MTGIKSLINHSISINSFGALIRYLAAIQLLIMLLGCSKTRFVEMKPDKTGIHFSNDLVYTDSLTILDFEYMYNGAGVGIIDVNNDGLQDLYFTGNMVSSRLFLNLGNWKFHDVTAEAKVGTTGWANGISIIDINQDGFSDIYVSIGGPRGQADEDRANLLFINNGSSGQTENGVYTFTESASDYGLDDTGYGVQASFLDYDRDGDLDVYLLSNALVNFNRNTSKPRELTGKAPSVDKLYRNNGDLTFTDVSKEAGILIEGFGLGVEICDINEDLWPDIYVANDFLTDDLIYVNQGDGSFKNQSSKFLKHQTFNGMGADMADINNDGRSDIVVLDMYPADNRRRKLTMMGNNYDEFHTGLSYGYQPQYVRNTLQLNNGNGTFSEIGQLAGIDATDWSWSPLIADYDNDGMKDLFITNGYRQDITNLDFMVYGQQVLQMGTEEANKKQRLEELNKLPGIKIPNYMYKNTGDLSFEEVSDSWGLTAPTYSNGAAYGDLDNDGDLDLVINNIDQKASVYQNLSEADPKPSNYIRIQLQGPELNRQGIGAQIYIKYQDQLQYQMYTPVRGYISSVEQFLHFGLGSVSEIDSLRVIWPDGKQQIIQDAKANQTLLIDYNDANSLLTYAPDFQTIMQELEDSVLQEFKHQENQYVDFKLQPLLPHMHSRNGPGLAVGDVDGDDLEDFFVGGATGYSGRMFMQQQDGSFTSALIGSDSLSEDMGVLFFDADEDQDQDLLIVSGGAVHVEESSLYADRLYVNDGTGSFTQSSNALPDLRYSGSSAVAADYDRDNDLDLFIGGRVVPGEYPLPSYSALLRNDLNHKPGKSMQFTDVTDEAAAGLSNIGLVTSALWTDYDNDGWSDLIVAGEFMPLAFYHNEKGKLVDRTEDTGLRHTSGWWNSLVGGDFDRDGDIDYLAGNLGLNTRFRASPEEPLCIYASDYDDNGRIDPVMCYYVQGKNYLAHSRDDIIEQINAMRARFRTYQDYAQATFKQSFLPEEIANAYVVKSENFASSYLENLGQGKFQIRPLPVEAQFAPIYGMTSGDYDRDGNLDVLAVGNFYYPEVSVGRYDASIGLFLKGDGQGNFEPLSVIKSGFFADGDAKGMATIRTPRGTLVLVANNSDRMKVFQINQQADFYKAKDQDVYALVTMNNGQRYKHEFYYGSTYLSHSSRTLTLTDNIQSIEVFDRMGNSRIINLDK